MATNPHFKYGQRQEQSLYEDLVIEAIQMYGQDVYYLPREIVNKDKIFLDDVPSHFSSSYKVEMYIENTDGFEGEGDLFTKFGIELRDQANFVVARKRWKRLIGDNLSEANFRPREGDIIYLPMSQSMFEIRKVETETPFYQIKNLPTFRMQCELFEYNDEDFDTGVEDIDEIEIEGAYTFNLTLDSDGTGVSPTAVTFQVGETATQTFDTYTMKGEVSRWRDSDKILSLVHVGATDGKYHTFTTDRFIISEGEAKATPTLVEEIQNIMEESQNKYFDDFESDFLDFSESNPFGDIS